MAFVSPVLVPKRAHLLLLAALYYHSSDFCMVLFSHSSDHTGKYPSVFLSHIVDAASPVSISSYSFLSWILFRPLVLSLTSLSAILRIRDFRKNCTLLQKSFSSYLAFPLISRLLIVLLNAFFFFFSAQTEDLSL